MRKINRFWSFGTSLSGNNSVEEDFFFMAFKRQNEKGLTPAMLLFQVLPAPPNASDLIRQTGPIRSDQRVERGMWAWCGEIERLQQQRPIRSQEKMKNRNKWNISACSHTQKRDFSRVSVEISQILHQIPLIPLSVCVCWLHRAHVKGYWFQIINLHWYSAWGVCVGVCVFVCPQVYPPLW